MTGLRMLFDGLLIATLMVGGAAVTTIAMFHPDVQRREFLRVLVLAVGLLVTSFAVFWSLAVVVGALHVGPR